MGKRKKETSSLENVKAEKSSFYKQALASLPPCVMITFTLFFYGPIELFTSNKAFFDFTFYDVIYGMGWIALLTLIFLTILLSLLQGKLFDWGISVIFGVGICCYIQGNFLNLSLGTLDGTAIHWEEYTTHSIINSVIWLVICALVFVLLHFRKKIWKNMILFVSLLIVAMQVVAGITILPSAIETTSTVNDRNAYYLSTEKQFEVSSNENTIVFVLDAFSQYQLNIITKDDPSILDPFRDFTSFTNGTCEIQGTFYGIAYLLTGYSYDYDKSYVNYMEDSWNSEYAGNFYRALHEANYECKVYSVENEFTNDPSIMHDKIDNLSQGRKSVDHQELRLRMTQLSLYRYVPHAIKQFFWMSTTDFGKVITNDVYTFDDIEFYRRLTEERLSIQNKKNSFIFYHLLGNHSPFVMDQFARLQTDDTLDEKQKRVEQAKGSLYIVSEYIDQMKELGIYENSNIIITADHGTTGNPGMILLIKQSGETHEHLQISSAPVSQTEFIPTVLRLVGLNYADFGPSVYEFGENDVRERSLRIWKKDENYPACDGEYNVIYEYKFTDDVNNVNFDAPPQLIHPLFDSYYGGH